MILADSTNFTSGYKICSLSNPWHCLCVHAWRYSVTHIIASKHHRHPVHVTSTHLGRMAARITPAVCGRGWDPLAVAHLVVRTRTPTHSHPPPQIDLRSHHLDANLHLSRHCGHDPAVVFDSIVRCLFRRHGGGCDRTDRCVFWPWHLDEGRL